MPFRILAHAYRKPGMSTEDFKKHYEAHVDLLKRLTGDDFPLSHKRTYTFRQTVEVAPEGATSSNATTPAVVLVGQQSEFDFDAYAELTFTNEDAFRVFAQKVREPEAASQIKADEELFLDRPKFAVVVLGDVSETKA
ncbi:uncharacterized protein N7484_003667 [Penicillium longicatenatum]|uniref:uncharacterized protein n=1 Tax=Penicillium longicatenatum TaxID=1561947 RepID=UPI0025470161|nr:uncharacterized protein N7484_003667 [Penicillium longicatenatum]KAJ5649944.1 hypothetical protein N7484_003667 [Penicillium longicatenatum]